MTKEEIIEYVMHSPANTNPAVLNSLLEQMGGGGPEFPSDVFLVTLDEDYYPTMSVEEVMTKAQNKEFPIAVCAFSIGEKTFYEYEGGLLTFEEDGIMFKFITPINETKISIRNVAIDPETEEWTVYDSSYELNDR